jgi:putative hydrolase of the HAD superfamily
VTFPAAVVLDIDDTLVDTRHAFTVAIGGIVARWLPHLDRAGAERALAHWVADADGHFRAYTRGEIGFTEQRARRARALHAAFDGPALDEDAVARWDTDYDDAFRRAWRLFPEASGFLDRLDAAGVPYGAVTNAGRDYQRDKLRRVGLGERLRMMVSVDDLGVGKPDPRVFRRACANLGVAPGDAVYVGDELDVDARGESEAGLRGIWLDRHGRSRELVGLDVPAVSSLTELADLYAW